MSVRTDLKYQFARLGMTEKLIVINTALFLVNTIVVFLFQLPYDFFTRWLELPKVFGSFILQPWSLISYAFVHQGFMHLFWNMILLYFSGRIFANYFSGKRLLTLYLMGAAAGGLIFLLSYNIFPAFSGSNSSLVGASAAVMAVFIFICTYFPNQEVRLIFFNLKLWYLGVFFVLLDLVQLPMGNPGGHLAHLGGALMGFFFAKRLQEGRDLGSVVERAIDSIKFNRQKKSKGPLRTVHRRETSVPTRQTDSKKEYQKQIDAILDKISKSGYDSLSKEEKDFLFKAGKEE